MVQNLPLTLRHLRHPPNNKVDYFQSFISSRLFPVVYFQSFLSGPLGPFVAWYLGAVKRITAVLLFDIQNLPLDFAAFTTPPLDR